MRKNQLITPEGAKDYLFEEAAERRRVQEKLRLLFEEHGFSEAVTPGLEFLDVFVEKSLPEEEMYRLTDRQGRQMALRPDSTLPIARLCATRLRGSALPIRFYYNQPVYTAARRRGQSSEVMQSGVEWIGSSGPEADLEVLSMAVGAMRGIGADSRLEIGHIGIFNALSEAMGLTAGEREDIRRTIEDKNYPALGELLDTSRPEAAVIGSLPRLFGGEEVFSQARALLGEGPALSALEYLHALYEGLCQRGLGDGVTVDLGLVNRADYYTGVVFKGYMEGYGQEVLSGGRYDKLLPRFGMDAGAVGFAVNVDAVARRPFTGFGKGRTARPLRIALTKGRLEEKTVALFAQMGCDCRYLQNKGRRLILPVPGSNLEVVLAKAADVITYIENGVCDMGVVGKDTILEYGGSFFEVADLGFGKCRFALAAKEGTDFYAGYAEKTIATKYPNVARSFFAGKGMDVRIVKIEGSVELAPLLSLADGIVDIVETGSTLRENGLRVVEEVAPVSARLIVNPVSLKLAKVEIEDWVRRIECAAGVRADIPQECTEGK